MNIGKIVLGLIIVFAGLWLLIPTSMCGGIYCPGLWKDTWFIIKGIAPVALVALGIALVWTESDKL